MPYRCFKIGLCFCYALAGIGSLVVLATLFIAQESTSDNCLVFAYKLTSTQILEYFQRVSCSWMEYSVAVLPALSAFLFAVTCINNCNGLIGCWIFQFACCVGAFLQTIPVTYIFTTSLIVFCEDFHNLYSYENKSCLQVAKLYDRIWDKNVALYGLQILIITVTVCWLTFLCWLFASVLTLTHIIRRSQSKKIIFLEAKIEDMQHVLSQQQLINDQRRLSYDFDPPDLHTYDCRTETVAINDGTNPLIHL